jgi:hypothetical protein
MPMLSIHGVAMQPNPTLMILGSLPERTQVHTRIGKALLCYCCTAAANLSIWHARLPSEECSLSKLLKRTLQVRSVT